MTGYPPHVGRKVTLDTFAFHDPGRPDVWIRALHVDGWDDAAASTAELTQRRLAPGAWRSTNPQLATVPITITGVVEGATVEAVKDTLTRIRAAAALTEVSLTVADTDLPALYRRVARAGQVLSPSGLSSLRRTFSVPLVAADPRKFGTTLAPTTGLPSQTGGLTFPETWPETWSAVTTTGQIGLTHPGGPGGVTGPVVARVTGPLPDFRITHVAASGTHVFAMAGLPLGPGEYVDIWMEAQTVLAMGQESRAPWISSRGWSGFEPGPNTWSITSNGAGSAAVAGSSLQIFATPAWE